MTVGFESDDVEAHDRVRGKSGSFDEAVRAVDMSLKAGMYTAISTVATHDKFATGTLEKMAGMANRLGAHEFRILEPVPTGSIAGQTEQILTADESKQIAEFHKKFNRKSKGVSVASFSHLESDEMFGCGAGYYHLFIDAVGNVCPCDLTPMSMGNASQEPLAEIWRRMGKWFDSARCGCFMKDVCDKVFDVDMLPLDRSKSESICDERKSETKLPSIFDNMLDQ